LTCVFAEVFDEKNFLWGEFVGFPGWLRVAVRDERQAFGLGTWNEFNTKDTRHRGKKKPAEHEAQPVEIKFVPELTPTVT